MTRSTSTTAAGILSLYTHIAPHYESDVAPAFEPLANDLASWAALCFRAYLDGTLDDPFVLEHRNNIPLLPLTALDLGCGTGLLARALAADVERIIGLDLADAMLTVAPTNPQIHYLTADLHALPFRSGAFRLAASSFGLNSTTPNKSLRSIARILRPNGGMFIFQEWGSVDSASQLVDDVVQEFTPDDYEYPDPALRDFFSTDRLWFDRLQDADDYYDALKRAGFKLVWVREQPFLSVPLTIEQFIRYKLAWASRRMPIEAMPAQRRTEFTTRLTAQLSNLSEDGVTLRWEPPLFRICAVMG